LTIDLFDLRLPFDPSILRVTYPLSWLIWFLTESN
jgi:hypothetical protein